MGIVLFILFSACVLFEARTTEVAVKGEPACPDCRYSLAGLPASGRCPECGELYSPRPSRRQIERMGLRPGVTTFWVVAAATLVVFEATGLGRWLSARGIIQSYVEDGYPMQVAINATLKRELAHDAVSVGQFLGGCWFGFSPLLAVTTCGWKRYAWLYGVGVLVLLLIYLASPRP